MTAPELDSPQCDLLRSEVAIPNSRIKLFGATIGAPTSENAHVVANNEKIRSILHNIARIPHPQVAYRLQRASAGYSSVNYLLRCQRPNSIEQATKQFDDMTAEAFANSQIPVPMLQTKSTQRTLLHVPIPMAGLGLTSAEASRFAAYTASVTDTHNLTQRLFRNIGHFDPAEILHPLAEQALLSTSRDMRQEILTIETILTRADSHKAQNGQPRTQRLLLRCLHEAQFSSLLSARHPAACVRPPRLAPQAPHENQKLRVHLLQCREPTASLLFSVPPSTPLRTKLKPRLWRTAIQRRLRLPTFPASTPHSPAWCPCHTYSRPGTANPLRKRRHSEIDKRRNRHQDLHYMDSMGDHASVCNRGSTASQEDTTAYYEQSPTSCTEARNQNCGTASSRPTSPATLTSALTSSSNRVLRHKGI